MYYTAKAEEREEAATGGNMRIFNLRKTYGDRVVLDIPEWHFRPGMTYAVVGHNGSGKSTLGKILAGVEKADTSGCVSAEPGETVAYMPQKSYGFHMSVRRNILLGAENTPENTARAGRYMERLELTPLAEKKANHLSGGETARMALARLLMTDRTFLILDEPTASMDVRSIRTAEEMLHEYKKETGATLLLITQSFSQARRMADQVICMHDGKIIESGDPEEVFDSPRTKEAREFFFTA